MQRVLRFPSQQPISLTILRQAAFFFIYPCLTKRVQADIKSLKDITKSVIGNTARPFFRHISERSLTNGFHKK